MDLKKKVLSCWRNVSSDGEALIVGGRSFHALTAATGKTRSPSWSLSWWNDQRRHCVGRAEVTTTVDIGGTVRKIRRSCAVMAAKCQNTQPEERRTDEQRDRRRYPITHSLFHSRLKSFLFCKSSLPQPFLFLLQDSLYGFPRLFTVTSEHIRLFTF